MRVQKTVTSREISWLVTYDDKSSIQVQWLWGSWCAHLTGRGPRGGVRCVAHVPMTTLEDLLYESDAYRLDGGRIPKEGEVVEEKLAGEVGGNED